MTGAVNLRRIPLVTRDLIALAIPLLCCAVQLLLWDWVRPYVWLLFFPGVIASAFIGRIRAGFAATALSLLLVGAFFLELRPFSSRPASDYFSALSFLAVGLSVTCLFGRLRRREQARDSKFEATFQQAAVGCAIVSLDGHWLQVNARLCEMLGYNEEELQQITFQDLTYVDDLEADLDQVHQLLAGEIRTYSMEKRYLHKSGSIVWARLTVALSRRANGASDFFISMVEDITTRKAMELALVESERRYRELVEHANCAIVRWGGNGAISFVNPFVERLLAWPAEQLIDEHYAKVIGTPSDLRQRPNQTVWSPEIDLSGEGEFDCACGDGRKVEMQWAICRVNEGAGEEAGYLAVGVDVTGRHRAENQLLLRNQELKRFSQLSIDRELRIIELKRMVNHLSVQAKQPEPFDLSFADLSQDANDAGDR